MNLCSKNILPSITNLESILNSGLNISKPISHSSDGNSPPNKIFILTSQNPLSSFSQGFANDLTTHSSCQAVVSTKNISTNTTSHSVEKQIQTFKTYHQTSRRTQTRSPTKPRLYSRKTQTNRKSVESIREVILAEFPNSPLLTLNSDQFFRIITGNSRIPYSQESILQGLQLQTASGTTGYNLLRSEIPNCFPSTSSIRESIRFNR